MFVSIFNMQERGAGDTSPKIFVKVNRNLLNELHKFRNGKNLNAWAVFSVIMLHMNKDGWASPTADEIRSITTLEGEQTLSDALKVLRNITVNGKRLMDHYRVRYPDGRWGASYYHIWPEEGGMEEAPADNLVLWHPQPATPPLTGGGSSVATPPLPTDGKGGGIYNKKDSNTLDRSSGSFRWKLVFVMQDGSWGVNEDGRSDNKDALEDAAALNNRHADDCWLVLSGRQEPKPYAFYSNKFWAIKQGAETMRRTLVKAVAERLAKAISLSHTQHQFDLYTPDGVLLYSLINGKRPLAPRDPDLLLDAITAFCFKEAKSRDEINALCARCVDAKKEVMNYLTGKYVQETAEKLNLAVEAAALAIQNQMPAWYDENKLNKAGMPLNRPQPHKFMETFIAFRNWISAKKSKERTAAQPAKALVEYGITADGRRVRIAEGVNRFQFVRTEMVEES